MWVRFHTRELEYNGLVPAFFAEHSRAARAWLLACSLASISCSGEESSVPAPSGSAGSSGAGGSVSSQQSVAVVTRVARLTHAQYDNTVDALLGVTDKPATSFAPDAAEGYAFDNGINLRVDGRLGPQYRAAAEELAEKVAADSAFLARFVACTEQSAGCSDQLIAELGKRAFRRPLSAAEQARFATLFARGAELVGSGSAFRDGVRLLVEALLQSPQFLYRSELSDTRGADGIIALDSWEMAARLSYFLWGTMPDQSLFDAAAAGKLQSAADVSAAAQRLLSDPKARASVVSFHAQALRFARFQKVAPDKTKYPNAPADMAVKIRDAAELFVKDVVFDAQGGIAELLNAPFAYADAGLAPIYGKSLSGTGLQKLTFAPGERAGYLMQAGFLASNAYAIRTDPIHRGLFVQRDLLCRTIPDPPPGASMTPLPPMSDTIKTTRQQVEVLTSPASCIGCHSMINAPGFAFEAYDATGAFRQTDNAAPIDTSGTTMLDNQPVAFANAAELVQALSQSAEARACYVGKWLEYAYGRSKVEGDAATRASLSQTPQSTLQLVAQVATTPGFRFRAPNPVE
jgi:hypothetical protein